jgi:hypothetical protein
VSFTVTLRRRGAVSRERCADLAQALALIERDLRAESPSGRAEQALARRYEPVQIVAARGEVAGPGVRGGVDLRADGSAEAFTGRWRRRVVAQLPGESAYDALARALAGGS